MSSAAALIRNAPFLLCAQNAHATTATKAGPPASPSSARSTTPRPSATCSASPLASSSPSSPLCSLRGYSSTLEVSISPVLCLSACDTVTSGTLHWRACLRTVRRCFADAKILTACWFPLFTIVFLYRLSAADAAPTDSADSGPSFADAAAVVAGTVGCAAARLATRGTKRPHGTHPTPSCRGRRTPPPRIAGCQCAPSTGTG
jgi:hypothetical protein